MTRTAVLGSAHQQFQGESGCPVLLAKIFLFRFFRNYDDISAIPTQYEGRTRRHEREAGCGGRVWYCATSDANADGEAVWSRRPDAGAKRVEDVFMRDGDNKARSHRGEHGISRKPSCRECRRRRLTCGDLLVCFFIRTQGCGRGWRPAFPAPFFFRG